MKLRKKSKSANIKVKNKNYICYQNVYFIDIKAVFLINSVSWSKVLKYNSTIANSYDELSWFKHAHAFDWSEEKNISKGWKHAYHCRNSWFV